MELIHAHLPASLPLAEAPAAPADVQYMPPGRHRIRASRAGKPVTVDVQVTAETAATLQRYLAAQLAAVAAGSEDRPFFDFNHEDREAAAWPTEFFWAGEDPKTGGVRARIDWSDAGRRAIEGRTFRRFSPVFLVDASGAVTGSTTNMGGFVNRAAFKRIAPLFAAAPAEFPAMQNLITALHSLELIEAAATEEADLVAQVTRAVGALKSEIADLKSSLATQARQRAESIVDAAVRAGRLAAKDADARVFWIDVLLHDESKALKALDALPVNPVLARITGGAEDGHPPKSLLARQEQKLAAVRAAHPGAKFEIIYAQAKAEAPDLFR